MREMRMTQLYTVTAFPARKRAQTTVLLLDAFPLDFSVLTRLVVERQFEDMPKIRETD